MPAHNAEEWSVRFALSVLLEAGWERGKEGEWMMVRKGGVCIVYDVGHEYMYEGR